MGSHISENDTPGKTHLKKSKRKETPDFFVSYLCKKLERRKPGAAAGGEYMKGILIAIAAAAVIGMPMTTGEHQTRQPLEITQIHGNTVEGTVQANDFNSRLLVSSAYPVPEPEQSPFEAQPTGSDESLVISSPESGGWQYYGVCTITHYCPCKKCCGQWASGYTASGTLATAYRTCAADLPFGTEVMIDGQVYVVEDRGVGGMWVDIFVDTHEEALQRGMYEREVYIR